ncbi:MAG: glycosyltransferase family 4 protein [Gemmataceae bacterium]
MRICLYTETALPKVGGQEMVVDALARQYLDLGHEPVVLAPYPRKQSVRGERYPYRVVRHPRFYSTHLLVGWYRWFLWKFYRQWPFDVLHCHGIYPPAYLASLLGNTLPVPVVVTSHGGDVYHDNVRLKKPVVKERCIAGIRGADALVAISRFTRDGFTRLCPEVASRVVDIPNGVHLGALRQPATKPPVWNDQLKPGTYGVFLGRLKHRKGVDTLLDAVARMTAPHQQFAIAGDGEERADLEGRARLLGLTSRVHFLGSTTGPTKAYLLQNARFLVIPSRNWEAFPLVVLEAFASGLPILGTKIPGVEDLIEPGRTGLVVPPESPVEMAAALDRLSEDDGLVSRLGAEAYARADQYDWPVVARRHLDLYQSLMATQSRRAA